MSFRFESSEWYTFDDLPALEEYVKIELEKYVMVPIQNFLDNKACFFEDKYYGHDQLFVKFNEDGIKSFCKVCGIPFDFINNLKEPGLTSMVLNDYLMQDKIKKRISRYNFVMDQKSYTVSGVVSHSYVGYSNKTFLDDLKKNFPKTISTFDVQTSYVINTRLFLRLLSPEIKAGIVTGTGGTGEDISRVGIQLSNSMLGDRPVKASFFVYRLVCANGLILASLNESGSVRHSGKEETFTKRLETNINPVLRRLKYVPEKIKSLSEINYDAEKIVKLGGAKLVYDIIPLRSWEFEERNRLKGKDLFDYDIKKISQYPFHYGGQYARKVFDSKWRDNQNMFDFINIFTEYAQKLDPLKRVTIEEKSGKLANWILQNKKSFC